MYTIVLNYLSVYLLQNKDALQPKCKCKCDLLNARTSSKMCALQPKYKCKCKYSLKYTSPPKCVYCNQNANKNANVIPKCAFQNVDLNQNTHLNQNKCAL